MSNRTPIALLVDDSCPLIHIYRNHWVDVHKRAPLTDDGRPLLEIVPNAFLDRFCDVVERRGIAGKFSIVPAPAGLGDVVQGIAGFDPSLTRAWLDTAQARLGARFDFCPEGLTHNLAVDLATGDFYPEGEAIWSQSQSRATLTPYLTRELELLKAAGVDITGITSCWVFGQQVEAEYIASIVAALKAVYNRDLSWFYLHIWHRYPSARPYIAYGSAETTLVAINSTVDDFFWETINCPHGDQAYLESVADRMLTADGRGGAIRTVLDAGGWPILMTHWQSFFSNGLETGLAVLDILGQRIADALADEVEWTNCRELAERTLAEWRA
ncbi:MAG: hypothetical protein ACJ8CR_30275 [Roseiflexaceae bacterium]